MSRSHLIVYPIGGVEEIGSNCTVYYFQNNLILVDLGMSMYSLDDLTPYQLSYLDLNKFISKFSYEIENCYCIITHCHDDHIGGLKLLNKEIIEKSLANFNIKIFVCSEFNREIINSKYGELNSEITVINYEQRTNIGNNICFSFYEVDHSIPDASSVYLEFNTLNKYPLTIFHTGDWRYDEDVIAIGDTENIISSSKNIDSKSLQTFVKLRNKCDIIVCESTNITKYSNYCNESMVAKELERIFTTCSSKEILFTCFASNVFRLKTVINICMKLGLRLGYLGKSLNVFINTAHKAGIFSNEEFVYCVAYKNIDQLLSDNAKVKMITGCQNEQSSILNRLVYAQKLNGQYTVIFSANVIPVVRKRVENLYKQMERSNVRVITTDTHPHIHSSGHATRKEILSMYDIIQPHISIPVHGNVVTVREHAKIIAKRFKIKTLRPRYLRYFVFNTTKQNNTPDVKSMIISTSNINNKYVGEKRVLNNNIFDYDNEIFRQRAKLICGGIIIINILRKLVLPIGTFISQDTTYKLIKICEDYDIKESEHINEALIRKIRIQIAKILFTFNGEIIIN